VADAEHIPRSAALLGGGVIGGGWAARLVLAGVDVRLYDPAPDAEQVAWTQIERARRAWRRLTAAPPTPEGTLTMAATVAEAIDGAELIQESAPEREPLKRALLAEASRAAAPDAVIATSTSGLRPSRLCLDMERPEQLVVGHPFNPVYLLPLVEVCASDRSSAQTVQRAAAIYRGLGMRPLIVRHEIDGFIADRLLEALWREALWLVADDVATAEEIDDAIRYGPGLRWSAMGTFLTYRLAGGQAGMRHFMAQFGPALELPWTHLTEVPALDAQLIEKIVRESDAQAAGRSIEELVRIRDDCLVAVLLGLKAEEFGAGEEIARSERRLLDAAAARDLESLFSDGWLAAHAAIVEPAWIDYNGHMTEFRYLQALADGTDALLRLIGIDAAYVAARGAYYTVETHIRHLGQAHAGDRVQVATQLLGYDEKRLHLYHELRRSEDGVTIATGEHMLLHVDAASGATAPAPAEVLRALSDLTERQRDLARPEAVGRRIALAHGSKHDDADDHASDAQPLRTRRTLLEQ
jgi:carnitine 3-dehydrogenase / betainyl-CoA thioesterase